MSSLNKATIIGHAGKDPEVRYAPSGDAICNLTIATSENWKDKATGEKREATEWHRVVFFGKLAEIAGQYVKKGSLMYVEGQIKTRKWQDKDGQDRYTTEINGKEMKLLGPRPDGQQEATSRPQQTDQHRQQKQNGYAPQQPQHGGGFDDDIPW